MLKETFIIRTEWADAIMSLKPAEQATILQNLFHYHSGNEAMVKLPNLALKLVWKLIEPNLKRNIENYDKRKDTSVENGKKGGRPPKEHGENLNNLNKPNEEPNNLPENLTEPNNPIVSVSVSVPVSDSVSDPVSVSGENAQSAINSQEGLNDNEPKSGKAIPVARPPSVPEQAWTESQCTFSDDAKLEWIKLCKGKKWKGKGIEALSAALKRLMDFEEEFALKLISAAIVGNYQGLVFGNTDADYYRWLKNKDQPNGTHKQGIKGAVIPEGRRDYGKL